VQKSIRKSAAEAEQQHRALLRATMTAAAEQRAKHAAPAAAATPYKPLLSSRDVIFSAPILSAEHPALATAMMRDDDDTTVGGGVFHNAPTSFNKNPHFATGSSTHFPMGARSAEELARLLHLRDDGGGGGGTSADARMQASDADAAGSSGGVASWPISMAGKSVASVSLSAAMRAKQARLAVLAAEAEAEDISPSTGAMPLDTHVHGPGISDHTQRRAHYDGYWELRTKKLANQRANAEVYARLTSFQTEEQRQAHEQREQRKQARQDHKNKNKRQKLLEDAEERKDSTAEADTTAAAADPAASLSDGADDEEDDELPFALAQPTPCNSVESEHHAERDPQLRGDALAATTAASPSSSSCATRKATAAEGAPALPRSQQSAAESTRPVSHGRARSTATTAATSASAVPIFAGVVAYINGDTDTNNGGGGSDGRLSATADAQEFSSLHLSNLVRLHGGVVLPYASRRQLTHYIASHLSLSKAREEVRALSGGSKAAANAAARHIHFVRPAWVRACMQAGRRVREEAYACVKSDLPDVRTALMAVAQQQQTKQQQQKAC
jgi:hypothetical protein